jgi:hypothetical protein
MSMARGLPEAAMKKRVGDNGVEMTFEYLNSLNDAYVDMQNLEARPDEPILPDAVDKSFTARFANTLEIDEASLDILTSTLDDTTKKSLEKKRDAITAGLKKVAAETTVRKNGKLKANAANSNTTTFSNKLSSAL